MLFLPQYNALLIVLGTTAGSVYYKEMQCFEAYHWALFVLGVGIVVGGVINMGGARDEANADTSFAQEAMNVVVRPGVVHISPKRGAKYVV